jgi:hypothetical protein
MCFDFYNRNSLLSSKGEEWYNKLFNVKYLSLFHNFKAIYQFPKHIIVLVKIVANASLNKNRNTLLHAPFDSQSVHIAILSTCFKC